MINNVSESDTVDDDVSVSLSVRLQPFWPMGTGIARGFLAALDSAWMIRSWSRGRAPLDVLAERFLHSQDVTTEWSSVARY